MKTMLRTEASECGLACLAVGADHFGYQGQLADLIALDRNFFTVPEEDIANIRVLQTVVGGKVVYEAEGQPFKP